MNKDVSEYAKTGVDYSKLEPFKRMMRETGKKTLAFPNKRGVFMNEDALNAHGAVFESRGGEPHLWAKTQEGLGNKNWIAEWMYENEGAGKTYYDNIAKDAALMSVNDLIAQGAMPVVFTDEVAAGDSEWFADEKRAGDLARGFYEICEEVGMALPAGESPALKYLINATPPVKSAPSLSSSVTGIIAPKSRLVTGRKLAAGDAILAAASSGIHANGISLVIQKTMEMPEKFLTKLPSGKTLGEETLIPTRSYVALVESLLDAEIPIHALLPATGSGIAKLAYDDRQFIYRIHSWMPVPPLMLFMKEQGISLEECVRVFNWGAGYYVFVPKDAVSSALRVGRKAGYDFTEVGVVENGERQVVFEPEHMTLTPPGGIFHSQVLKNFGMK